MKKEYISRILQPIAKLFLKMGVNFNELTTVFSQVYIDEAAKLVGSKAVNISAKTGIDRRTVSKILKQESLYCPTDKLVLITSDIKKQTQEGKNDISIHGENSLESIIQSNANGRYTLQAVLSELERSGRIKIIDDKIRYLLPISDGGISNEKMAQLLGDSLSIISEVANYSRTVNKNKLIYRWDYSEQISPENSTKASNELFKQCLAHSQENIKLLESFETTRFRTYPRVGIMQAQFNYDFFK